MSSMASDMLIITVSIISLGIFGIGVYWLYHRYFIQRIRYIVYIDDGVRLRACSATPVETFTDQGVEWLRLKTKCFENDVVVPRNSFRIFYSRIRGSWLGYIVDSKGTPKAWGTDKIDKALTYETYRKIMLEQTYSKLLAGILRYDVVKLMAIVVIAALVVVAIALFYRPPPEVIIKEIVRNTTAVRNTTTIPPPPG